MKAVDGNKTVAADLRRYVRRFFSLAAVAVAAWAATLLFVAGFAPKDIADTVRFRSLTHVAETDADNVDPASERALVLVRGTTSSPESVLDPLLPGVETNAIALSRRVEMFQWIEKPSQSAPGVRYEGAWVDGIVPSSSFQIPAGHENPASYPPQWISQEFTAPSVRLGAYLIIQKSRLKSCFSAVPMASADPVFVRNGKLLPEDSAPEVGDLRISWFVIPHRPVTILAAQRSDKVPASARRMEAAPLSALVAQEGGAIADKLFLCAEGDKNAEQLFEPFRNKHVLPDWLLWRAHVFATEIVSPSSLLQLAGGLGVSIALFVLTVVFSLPIGLGVALARMSKNGVVAGIARIYISIVRGTPLMLQLLFVYFGPYYLFGWSLSKYPAFAAATIAFSLNYAAYFAEIYRSGIESIPVGQHEAAKMLGFTKRDAFLRIILPQVVKRILPPVTNEVITLVKDTSLAQVISVVEMFTIAKQLGNAQTSISPLIVAGVFYYVFNWLVAVGMERIERKLSYYR